MPTALPLQDRAIREGRQETKRQSRRIDGAARTSHGEPADGCRSRGLFGKQQAEATQGAAPIR